MEKATIIGIDLAKQVFQVHAAAKDGRPVLRKKVSRAQLLGFLVKQPRAIVAMEACATAHEWGRAISGLGHDVRLIPPIYVKPFVHVDHARPFTAYLGIQVCLTGARHTAIPAIVCHTRAPLRPFRVTCGRRPGKNLLT